MNKVNNIKHLHQHPDDRQLQNYVSGQLKGGQLYAVEKHLVDCEMCSDYVEGLQLIGVERNLELSSQLQIQLGYKYRVRKKRNLLYFMVPAVAAASLLFVVLFYIQQFQFHDELAIEESTSAHKEQIEIELAKPEVQYSDSQIHEQKEVIASKEAKAVFKEDIEEMADEILIQDMEVVADDVGMLSNDYLMEESEVVKSEVFADSISFAQPKIAYEVEKIDNYVTAPASNRVEVNARTKTVEAVKQTDLNKRKVNRNDVVLSGNRDELVNYQSVDTLSHSFKIGVDLYEQKKYEKAQKVFVQLLQSNLYSNTMASQYYLALCLHGLDRKRQLQKHIDSLNVEKHKYREELMRLGQSKKE